LPKAGGWPLLGRRTRGRGLDSAADKHGGGREYAAEAEASWRASGTAAAAAAAAAIISPLLHAALPCPAAKGNRKGAAATAMRGWVTDRGERTPARSPRGVGAAETGGRAGLECSDPPPQLGTSGRRGGRSGLREWKALWRHPRSGRCPFHLR